MSSQADTCITLYADFMLRAYHAILQGTLCRSSIKAYDLYLSHIPDDIAGIVHYCGYDVQSEANKQIIEQLTQEFLRSVTADAPRPTERKNLAQSCMFICQTQIETLELIAQQMAQEGHPAILELWNMQPTQGDSLKQMALKTCMLICNNSDTSDHDA